MIYRILGLTTVALLVGSSLAHCEENENTDIALRVVKLLDSKGAVVPAFKSMLPERASRQLLDRILLESPEIWGVLEGEVAAVVRSRFSDQQLREVETFLSSDTGRAWTASTPEILAAFQGTSNDPSSFSFQFASIGCVIAFVGPNIEAGMQKAGVEIPDLTDEVYAAVVPVKNAARTTCDCILNKGLARWPDLSLMQLQLTGEYQQYVQELLESGGCPMPFPQ